MCVSVINTAFVLTGYIDYFSHSAIVETTILQRTGKPGGEDDGFSLSICSSLRLTLVLHSISLLLPTLSNVTLRASCFSLPSTCLCSISVLLFVYLVGSRIMSFKPPRCHIVDHIHVPWDRT